jgi:UDP-glucose 4-epimerase
MTRFMIDTDTAIDLIEKALTVSGYNLIPDIPSFKVLDLFEIFAENFGLQYDIGVPRISEKLHEMMFSAEEAPRISIHDNSYVMHYKEVSGQNLPFKEFTSDKVVVSKEQLNLILKKYNYFKKDLPF